MGEYVRWGMYDDVGKWVYSLGVCIGMRMGEEILDEESYMIGLRTPFTTGL